MSWNALLSRSLIDQAWRYGEELAWSRDAALGVLDQLQQRGMTVLACISG